MARDPRLIEAQLGMSRAIARLRPSRLRTDLLATLRFSLGRDAFADESPSLRQARALALLGAALDLAERDGVPRLEIVARVNRETMGSHMAMDRADAIDLIADSLVRLVAGEATAFRDPAGDLPALAEPSRSTGENPCRSSP